MILREAMAVFLIFGLVVGYFVGYQVNKIPSEKVVVEEVVEPEPEPPLLKRIFRRNW